MKHDNTIKILAHWCKKYQNTPETSYDYARGHLEILEAKAVVQAVNVLGDMLEEILEMDEDQIAHQLDEVRKWRPQLFTYTDMECEMCGGQISEADHAYCDICPMCLEGCDEEEEIENQKTQER